MIKLLTKSFKIFTSMRDAKGRLGKNWLRSKTIWANILIVVGIVFANYLGTELTSQETASLMAVVNLVLRLITTEPVGFIDLGQ